MGIYLNPGNRGFQTILNGVYVDKTGLIDFIFISTAVSVKDVVGNIQKKVIEELREEYPSYIKEQAINNSERRLKEVLRRFASGGNQLRQRREGSECEETQLSD
ncbi:MAG: hypothetical protein LUE65_13145 [Clostridiales bacterium]|nr:hypothetical protein [Clostridiales bacterium]